MPAVPPLISVVFPIINEAECLAQLHEELRLVCDQLHYQFEFIFVEGGSTDRTPDVLAELRERDSRVRYLLLSRNFGHQPALSAGLAFAAGEAVIMMDGDLQHPPAVIPLLLERYEAGFDVVNTCRRETVKIGFAKRICSRLFYRIFNWAASLRIEPGGADFRLMSRETVDALNALPERQRFYRGLVPWLGYRQTTVDFVAPQRWAGESKYTFWRSLRFALDGVTAFSFYPLRKMALFGWLITLASFLYGVFAVAMHLLNPTIVPGWASLMTCVLFLGGCQLLVAGVLGEYVGRILEQVKGRPLYIVRQAVGLEVGSRQQPELDGTTSVRLLDETPADSALKARRAG